MLRVFVADDEEKIRAGIKKLIDWEKLGCEICGEAGDGKEALDKIVRLKPDVVLIDIKMPELSGLDVIKSVSQKTQSGELSRRPHFLVLSGFSEFEYAQGAMNFGAEGYFVKPIDEDALEDKIADIIEEEREAKAALLGADTRRIFEQMFLLGEVDESFDEKRDDGSSYQVALFSSERCGRSGKVPELEKKIQKYFSALDMFTLVFDDDVLGVFKNCVSQSVLRYLEQFAKKFSSAPFIVAGPREKGMHGALASFMECRRCKDALFFASDRTFVDSSAIGSEPREPFAFKAVAPEVLFCVETYERARLQKVMDFCRANFLRDGESGCPSESVKTQCIAYVIELQEQLRKKYPERALPAKSAFDISPAIMSKNRLSEAFGMAEAFTNDCLEMFHGDGGEATIVKLVAYVKANHTSPIRLSSLGEMFYCNSAYLGKRFKEHTGVSFTTFVDTLRVEDSKRLLRETNMKIYQVAKLVGYSRSDYFFMKFKKYTGLTPKEFRKKFPKGAQ